MDTVQQGSTAYLTVAFRDKTGQPATPTAISWRAYDKATRTELQAATPVTPAASSVEIVLPPAVSDIVTASREYEVHVVVVLATYGETDAAQAEYEYQVHNLERAP